MLLCTGFDLDAQHDTHIETEALAEVDAEIRAVELGIGVRAAGFAARTSRLTLELAIPSVPNHGKFTL